MLEVRYVTATGQLTGLCYDESQFGNLDRERHTETVVIIQTSIITSSLEAYLFDVATQNLIPNPTFSPDPDLARLEYLLSTSPPLIPMPDLQEVVRLLAKTRGVSGA